MTPCSVAAEVLQTFTYGSLADGDVDLVGLSAKANEVFCGTLVGYAVDNIPWRMCNANFLSFSMSPGV